MTRPSRRIQDHRIKEQIVSAGDPDRFPELEIPRSTVQSWVRRGVGDVVSLDTGREVERELRARVLELEHRSATLIAVLRLVPALLRVSGFTAECRTREGSDCRSERSSARERPCRCSLPPSPPPVPISLPRLGSMRRIPGRVRSHAPRTGAGTSWRLLARSDHDRQTRPKPRECWRAQRMACRRWVQSLGASRGTPAGTARAPAW